MVYPADVGKLVKIDQNASGKGGYGTGRMRGRLVSIVNADKCEVKPFGHKKLETVPRCACKVWRSRNGTN